MSTENKPDIPPFVINIPDDTLIDLKRRLNATRWSTDLDNEGEFYGLSTSYLKDLADYWANGFDWRAAERKINEFKHHRVKIDGVPVHFIREPGIEREAHRGLTGTDIEFSSSAASRMNW
jgi:hypothetical protein